jgi:hypothetical protein
LTLLRRRIQDGAHALAFSFDRAERLTQVAQADGSGDPSTPVLKTLAYATTSSGSNLRNGKLEVATSNNPDLTSASVVETYAYDGAGNIKQVGTASPYHTFLYDKVSRLTSGSLPGPEAAALWKAGTQPSTPGFPQLPGHGDWRTNQFSYSKPLEFF